MKKDSELRKNALIVGASGIAGSAVADLLSREGWAVTGLARKPVSSPGVTPLAANLLDPLGLRETLADARPELVVITTWIKRPTEAEMVDVNGRALRDLLEAMRVGGSVRHVALVTGLKHYLGPFEAYGQGNVPPTPFRETQGRLDVPNFYYAQEDAVFEAAERESFTWSVHRAHTIIGKAVGNAMNMGTTLAVYATLCRELGRPFMFPGSPKQWECLTDMTDARLLADHVLWAATTPRAANEAFNVVDGDVFRWSWMWGRIAGWFGIEAVPFDGAVRPLEEQMADDSAAWASIAERDGLVEPKLEDLASPWHTDGDLGRPIEVVTDMSKSRKIGFATYQATDEAFFDLFKRLRSDRLIP